MKKEKLKRELRGSPMADSGRESFGDEGPSSRELERLRRHLKLAQQHLDLAYQADEGSPSRSSSPRSTRPPRQPPSKTASTLLRKSRERREYMPERASCHKRQDVSVQIQAHASGMMFGKVSYLNEYPPSDVVVILRDLMLPGTGAQHWVIPSIVVVRSKAEQLPWQ
ncbi:hypothetical protein INR49_029255 [Caranx melampygus]|nr:hypothetical protein INR49_029255 [Caranx melampygus]